MDDPKEVARLNKKMSLILLSLLSIILVTSQTTVVQIGRAQIPISDCIEYIGSTDELSITCERARLSDIANSLSSLTPLTRNTLVNETDDTWLLNANLFIGPNTTFVIDPVDTKWLKINTPYGIEVVGNLIIDSVKITSWDNTTNSFATTDGDKPRPYIIITDDATGQMNITNSEIAYLGYNDGNSQGLVYHGGSGSIVKNNEIHHMWFGFYSQNVTDLVIEGNHVHDNVIYGLDPHSGTTNMIIRNNLVHDIAEGIGIICAEDCDRIYIENNEVYNTMKAAIMLTGNTNNSMVRSNKAYNAEFGISVFDNSNNNLVSGNEVSNTRFGIRVNNSTSNTITNNIISNSTEYGICATSASNGNEISSNFISTSPFGICVQQGSSDNKVLQNEIIDSELYGLYSLDSGSANNEYQENVVGGSGTAAIRLYNSGPAIFVNNHIEGTFETDYSIDNSDLVLHDTTFSSSSLLSIGSNIVRLWDSNGRIAHVQNTNPSISVNSSGIYTELALNNRTSINIESVPLTFHTEEGTVVRISSVKNDPAEAFATLKWSESTIQGEGTVSHRLRGLDQQQGVQVREDNRGTNSQTDLKVVSKQDYLEFDSSLGSPRTYTVYYHVFNGTTAVADTTKTESLLFGCALHVSIIHCDPVKNELIGNLHNGLGTYSTAFNITADEAKYVDGKAGNSLQFIARYRESVFIDDNPSLNPAKFSVSFWMKRTPEEEEPYAHIVSHATGEHNKGWVFDISETAEDPVLRFSVFNDRGDSISPSDVPIELGPFIHIVGTFDGTTVRIYKNGVMTQEAIFTGDFNSTPGIPLRIGSASFSTSNFGWSGILDEVAYFDRAISEDEIKFLYERPGEGIDGAEGSTLRTGLLGYWGFDGDTDDISGNGNHGSIPTMVTSMAFTPDGRLFFDERTTGQIKIVKNGEILAEPFATISDYYVSWEQGLLGIAIDNRFEQNNFVYLFYTAVDEETDEVFNRVVRYTDVNDRGTDATILLDRIPAVHGYHAGGALAFNPIDDKLYITVGDMTEHEFALDPNILIGKVLRINRDGSIPADNPFPGSPVYTTGHRNMYGLAFDREGYGIITENGETRYDEINVIQKAGNYGFPLLQPANKPAELADPTKSILPIRSYWAVIAPTQAIYYDGDKIPQLKGKFIFGTYVGDVYALTIDKDTNTVTNEEKIDLQDYPFFPVISIAQSPDGDIYYGSFAIKKLNYLEVGGSTPHLFFVSTNMPSTTRVDNMEFDQDNNRILLNLQQQTMSTDDASGESSIGGRYAGIKISRTLFSNVASVNDENGRSLNFGLLDEELLGVKSEFITITIPYEEIRSTSTVLISGSTTSPEEPEDSPPLPPVRATVGVDIVRGATDHADKAYSPNPIEIMVGDTITFVNRDSVLHTATSGNGETGEKSGIFDTSLLGPNRAAEIRFESEGEFPYFCELHPTMVGVVKVTASSAGAGGSAINGKTPDFKVSSLFDGRTYEVVGNSGTVRGTALTIEPENSVIITFEGSGEVELSLPKSMIEGISSVTAINGQLIQFENKDETDSTTTISFMVSEDARIVEIMGAKVVPEFSLISLLILAMALFVVVTVTRTRIGGPTSGDTIPKR